MTDLERRQAEQKALGVAACAAVFAVGGPLVSQSAETHKEGEAYLANIGQLSLQLAEGAEAESAVGVASVGASVAPVSYKIAVDAIEGQSKERARPRNLFEHASFTARDLENADKSRAEIDCLAEAVYYEARSESTAGQMAVAEVVLNRVADSRYPNSVCEVVYQGEYRSTGCQFTFTCDGSKRREPRGRSWDRSRAVALHVSLGLARERTGNATHYHTYYVDPYWSAGLVETRTIGSHIFYRFPRTQNEWRITQVAMQARAQHDRAVKALEAAEEVTTEGAELVVDVSAPAGADVINTVSHAL